METQKREVAVVILNYNGVEWLRKFLATTIKNSKNADIYVIDNNSFDNSIDYIKENFKEVNIIKHEENYGFCKGYNLGLKEIKSNYFVLLNNDVEVTENWIEPIIKYMNKNKEVAACQPKILDYYNKNKFEYAGAAGGFIDKNGYPFCRGRIMNTIEEDKGQYNDNIEIHWATGACLFIKSKAYKENKGLDENFFAHMEEIDLCTRLRIKKHKIMYISESKVYHAGSGTLKKESKTKTFLNFRNNLIFIHKNLYKKDFQRIFFRRIWLDSLAKLNFLLKLKINHSWSIKKAYWEFWNLNKKEYKKEKKSYNNIFSSKNIIWEYYFKRNKRFTDIFK